MPKYPPVSFATSGAFDRHAKSTGSAPCALVFVSAHRSGAASANAAPANLPRFVLTIPGDTQCTAIPANLGADSARLAIGSDVQGRGRALLYDADTNALLAAWEHDKAVFSVRLSPNGRLLAVAGYGGKMTLYDACTYFQLHEVQYTSMRGPPFIWSTDFSGDSRYLAVGNWNGSSYLYEIDEPFQLPTAR